MIEDMNIYKKMLQSMKDLVYICSSNYKIVFANTALIEKIGYDIIGMDCYRALYDLDGVCPWCIKGNIGQDGEIHGELLNAKDQRTYHVSHSVFEEDGKGRRIMTVLRDVTELKRAEEGLREQSRVNAAIAALAALMLAEDSIERLSQLVLETALSLTSSAIGYIGIADPKSDHFVSYVFSSGVQESCEIQGKQGVFNKVGGLCGWVVRNRLPLICNNPAEDERSTGTPQGHFNIERFMSVPVMAGDHLLGQLALANSKREYKEDDVLVAKRIANIYAMGVQRSHTQKILLETEDRFRTIAEISIDLIYRLDMQGKVTYASPASQRLLGYPAENLVGRSIWDFLSLTCKEKVLAAIDRLKNGELVTSLELELLAQGGRIVPVETNLVAIKSGEQTVGAQGIARDITVHRAAEAALKQSREVLEVIVRERTAELIKANERLKEEIEQKEKAQSALLQSEAELKCLSAKLIGAQEEERRRISRELHDGLGQSLSAIRFTLEGYLQRRSDQSKTRNGTQTARLLAMLKEAVEEVRRISSDLRPPVLDDFGIIAAIGWLSRNFEDAYHGITVRTDLEVKESDVPPTLKIVIYRVIQEALNNVAKHSLADSVRITLGLEDSSLVLKISDNGKGMGFTPVSGAKEFGSGLGLLSMKERAALSGGEFSIESAEGKGTTLIFRWTTESFQCSEEIK